MRDYYEILGLRQDADESEIKSAYRKAALKYHPDRNFGNVEEATREFADVQTAYEILSDNNERAWYDRHKESILRGGNAEDLARPEQDVEGLSADQLFAYFGRASSAPLDDSANGFFTTFRKLFDNIISEEEEACAQQGLERRTRPSFGGSQTDDADVRAFYSHWSEFSSDKTFSWAEQYAYHRAPDRRVRRAMEKKNAKARQTERKDYNEVVHKLVSYLKKRDYRYFAKPQVSAAQRQQDMLAARKLQSEASRTFNKSNMAEFEEQEWQKVDHKTLAEDQMQAYDEWEMQIECVACSKCFKSEKQFAMHEKSKKHIQTVKKLKWELKKEARDLGLEYESDDSFATAAESGGCATPNSKELQCEDWSTEDAVKSKDLSNVTDAKEDLGNDSVPSTKATSIASDDEYGDREQVEARLDNQLPPIGDLEIYSDDGDPDGPAPAITSSKKKKKKKVNARKKNRGLY